MDAIMQDTTAFIQNLETRIDADATLAQAEEWWSLALTIGSSLDRDDATSDQERQASHRLLWAVSGAIRAMKASERADHRDIRIALAGLRHSVGSRTAVGAPCRAG